MKVEMVVEVPKAAVTSTKLTISQELSSLTVSCSLPLATRPTTASYREPLPRMATLSMHW